MGTGAGKKCRIQYRKVLSIDLTEVRIEERLDKGQGISQEAV